VGQGSVAASGHHASPRADGRCRQPHVQSALDLREADAAETTAAALADGPVPKDLLQRAPISLD
jgi:hypothetical protein